MYKILSVCFLFLVSFKANAQGHIVQVPFGNVPADSISLTVIVVGTGQFDVLIYDRWGNVSDQFESPVTTNDTVTPYFDVSDYQNDTYYWLVMFKDSSEVNGDYRTFSYFRVTKPWVSFSHTSIKDDLNLGAGNNIYSYMQDVYIPGVKGSASIFDISGKQVHQSEIGKGENVIRINQRGLFLVRVESEGHRTTKKVYLN